MDIDPLLLDLARDAYAGHPRIQVLARQLAEPGWTDGLEPGFGGGVEDSDGWY